MPDDAATPAPPTAVAQTAAPLGKARPRDLVRWVDYLKGLGILAVVFYHVWDGTVRTMPLGGAGGERFTELLELAVRTSAMGVFFFASGLFLVKPTRVGYGPFTLDNLRTLLWPYLVWGTAQLVLVLTLAGGGSRGTSARENLIALGTGVFAHFWFLGALLVITLLWAAVYRPLAGDVSRPPNPRARIAAWVVFALALLPLVFDLPPTWFGPFAPLAYHSRKWLPILALGAAVAGPTLRWSEVAPIWQAALLSLAGAAATFATLALPLDGMLARFDGLLLGTAATALGTGVCVLLARPPVFTVLGWLGALTLQIYVMHVIFLAATRVALSKVLHVNDPTVQIAVGFTVGVVGPVIVALLAKRLRLEFLFRLPKPPKPAAVAV